MKNLTLVTNNTYSESNSANLVLAGVELGEQLLLLIKQSFISNPNTVVQTYADITLPGQSGTFKKVVYFTVNNCPVSFALGFGASSGYVVFVATTQTSNYSTDTFTISYDGISKKYSVTISVEIGNNFVTMANTGYAAAKDNTAIGYRIYSNTKEIYILNPLRSFLTKPTLTTPSAGYCLMCNGVSEKEIIPSVYTYSCNPNVSQGEVVIFGGKQYITLYNNFCVEI